MKRSSKKGFTLAELLIVIAIIAILISIMFPVFGAQLDKARAAAELANVRAKYSEMVADAMLGETTTDPNNLNTLANLSNITIKATELAKAMKYTDTKVTVVSGDGTNKGLVTVNYKVDYEGSFEVDEDVLFDVEGTYDKTGTKS